MSAYAVVAAILFGIATLLGVWYNGKNYGKREVEAEVTQTGADLAAEHTKKLEEARAKDDEAARQKDLDEAKTASSSADAALDFLRKSQGSKSPGPR